MKKIREFLASLFSNEVRELKAKNELIVMNNEWLLKEIQEKEEAVEQTNHNSLALLGAIALQNSGSLRIDNHFIEIIASGKMYVNLYKEENGDFTIRLEETIIREDLQDK